MKNLKEVKKQKGKEWIDSEGRKIEKKRCTQSEVYNEGKASKIALEALSLLKKLSMLKKTVSESSKKSYKLSIAEEIRKPSKDGNINHSWYSFNKDVKIQIFTQVSKGFKDEDRVIINDFLNQAIESDNLSKTLEGFVKSIISTKDHKIQTTQINKLAKMNETPSEFFNKAIEYAKNVVTVDIVTEYHNIFVKNIDGEFKQISLNYSGIDLDDEF